MKRPSPWVHKVSSNVRGCGSFAFAAGYVIGMSGARQLSNNDLGATALTIYRAVYFKIRLQRPVSCVLAVHCTMMPTVDEGGNV